MILHLSSHHCIIACLFLTTSLHDPTRTCTNEVQHLNHPHTANSGLLLEGRCGVDRYCQGGGLLVSTDYTICIVVCVPTSHLPFPPGAEFHWRAHPPLCRPCAGLPLKVCPAEGHPCVHQCCHGPADDAPVSELPLPYGGEDSQCGLLCSS